MTDNSIPQRPTTGNGERPARKPYEDERTVVCDTCGVNVPVEFGEWCYNAEADLIYFTCNRCLFDERMY